MRIKPTHWEQLSRVDQIIDEYLPFALKIASLIFYGAIAWVVVIFAAWATRFF